MVTRSVLKYGLCALVVAGAFSTGSAVAAQIPVALIGYNQQVVIGSGNAPVTSTIDGGTSLTGSSTFYSVGYNGASPTSGLTSGLHTSLSDGTTQFTLQAFTGNDAVVVNSSNTPVTLTLSSPSAYSSLSFFTTAAIGPSTINYSLNYTSGAPVTGSFTVADWYSATGAALIAGGYASPDGSSTTTDDGHRDIYQVDLGPLASVASLASITLSYGSGSNATFFGVSGTQLASSAVPEPASLALLCVGAVGVLFARRRNAV